jgi:hypothetical protein
MIAVHTQRESRLTYAYGVSRLANGRRLAGEVESVRMDSLSADKDGGTWVFLFSEIKFVCSEFGCFAAHRSLAVPTPLVVTSTPAQHFGVKISSYTLPTSTANITASRASQRGYPMSIRNIDCRAPQLNSHGVTQWPWARRRRLLRRFDTASNKADETLRPMASSLWTPECLNRHNNIWN